MRTIGIVTVARSDYGIYFPLLQKIKEDSNFALHLIVSGMHLSKKFGMTVESIKTDGFSIGDQVEIPYENDAPEGIAQAIGHGILGYAASYQRKKVDLLIVLGDRFEMHAASLAALPFKIPVVHIHGGELTEGAIDDALRHSITKLSHLHFVATQEYANRVMQLGEEPWRVTISGALALDRLQSMKLPRPETLETKYGFRLTPPPLLVTFHPVTLEYEKTKEQIQELLEALKIFQIPIIFTSSNADTANQIIRHSIEDFVSKKPQTWYVENLGLENYWALMSIAGAMVGNSSSGIIEAPSFKLPVVNVGNRQKGRTSVQNVIHVGKQKEEIIQGIKKALNPHFKEEIKSLVNPYMTGNASQIILDILKNIPLDNCLLIKKFNTLKNVQN